MKYVSLPTANEDRPLSFYLAMEEFLAHCIDEQDLFFTWQVQPTVIFGRNQEVENEVNIDYCREHGIQMFRRKSGGGCVYADRDNVMFSYISKDEEVGPTFSRFLGMLQLVLRKMGIESTTTSHNDLLIDGRKVSGTAFYHLPGRSIVHSTMLFDTNMEYMLNAITPSKEKLESHGVKSVRQRITLLKDHTTMSLSQFKELARQTLCDGELKLGYGEVTAIKQLEQEYLRNEFIMRM